MFPALHISCLAIKNNIFTCFAKIMYYIVNRLLLKKLLINNINNFECRTFNSISARTRNYSNYYNTIPQPRKCLGINELEEYNMHFEPVMKFLITAEDDIPEAVNRHLKKIFKYNVPCNKQITGPLVVLTYKYFARLENQTPENLSMAYKIGWINDILASSFQMIDDMVDLSETRYNKPCWYLSKDVGMKAVYDAGVLSESVFKILRKYLAQHRCYVPMFELVHDINLKVIFGQILDTTMCNLHNDFNLKYFTPEMYKTLSRYKGSIPFFMAPISLGMYLAEVLDENLCLEITPAFEMLGEYFISQNDILDYYGNPETTGKKGTDISTGKCTWLAVRTLMDANPSQRELFQKNYGKSDLSSQQKIYDLYSELDILNKFLLHENIVYQKLTDMVEKLSDSVPKEFMFKIINSIYGKI